MLLNWLLRNKYRLLIFIIGLLLLADAFLHKGLVRVLLTKKFPDFTVSTKKPRQNILLINDNKEWKKAVNTIDLMNKVDIKTSGLECDIYFDTIKKMFDVHHNIDNSIGLNFENLLQVYSNRGLHASIWMDFKNLNEFNFESALTELIKLRDKYHLNNKVLVESYRVDLLKHFSDKNFFTSYYTPYFNPYLISTDSMLHWVNELTATINNSDVNAISGYYFQYPFLHKYFPNYPILIWSPNDKMSIVNRVFKKKIMNSPEVFISLYP
jgi:hypothetical protein